MATINGTSGNDSLTSGALSDEINGLDGRDTLQGGDGADTLWGGGGDDILQGGHGNDIFHGGSGRDVVVYEKPFSDYRIERLADGTYRISDLTNDEPDGVPPAVPFVDIIGTDIEKIQFLDLYHSINISQEGNFAPTAVADVFNVTAGQWITKKNVLANDSDPNAGDRLILTAINGHPEYVGASNGVVTQYGRLFVRSDGTLEYGQYQGLPKKVTSATETFTYTVMDDTGASSTGTITINITKAAATPKGGGKQAATIDHDVSMANLWSASHSASEDYLF